MHLVNAGAGLPKNREKLTDRVALPTQQRSHSRIA
jgi:hypothetical protein